MSAVVDWGQAIFHDFDHGNGPERYFYERPGHHKCRVALGVNSSDELTTGELTKWETLEYLGPMSAVIHRVNDNASWARARSLALSWTVRLAHSVEDPACHSGQTLVLSPSRAHPESFRWEWEGQRRGDVEERDDGGRILSGVQTRSPTYPSHLDANDHSSNSGRRHFSAQVQQWLANASVGFCGATHEGDAGDCALSDMGSWGLRKAADETLSFAHAADACLTRCSGCERCAYISISPKFRDCSWYSSCDLARANQDVPKLVSFFRSGPSLHPEASLVTDPPPRMPPVGTWPRFELRAPAAAIAIQISGHLRGCDLGPVDRHARACRERFGRCDVFVHTWTESVPSTPHWSGSHYDEASRGESSAACVRKLRKVLQPTAVLVERQEPPPLETAELLAPDELPFDQGKVAKALHWGPLRSFGWRSALVAMYKAGELRRQVEMRESRRYDLVVRLRPDGLDSINSSPPSDMYQGGRGTDIPPETRNAKNRVLWDCIALQAGASSAASTHSLSKLSELKRKRWFDKGRASVNVCSADTGMEDGNANDNCFFGAPEHVDILLSQLALNHSATFRAMRRDGIPQMYVEYMFKTAGKLSGVSYNMPCNTRTLFQERLV